jgi:serine/threonine-protein kinase
MLGGVGQNGAVTALAPGDVFGGYRIEAVAGRGGMGVVYRAVQLDGGRVVALKLIASDRAADPEFRQRFQREQHLAAAIDHPNVVPVHGVGEEDGQLYLAMRYVRGTDLHELIRSEGPLSAARAAAIVRQVAAALDAAHAAGLVHRDVKPANVLVAGGGADERAYLSDFGLSRLQASDTRLTQTGGWIGTTDFTSPEQLRGEHVDARADVYSLGCVLFTTLAGRPPFVRDTVPATILAHLSDPPPRATEIGAPEGFDRVIARALAKEPAERYPSAGDLARAADAAARGEPVTESERSVAVGPAAPGVPSNGHAAAPTAVTTISAPPTAVRPKPAARPPRRPRRGGRAVAVGVAAAGVATGAALIAVSGGARDGDPSAPLSDGEVRDAAEAFARAYATEDSRALGRLLSGDVLRVLPAGVARGRARVVTEYERQFQANQTESYELDDLAARGGRAGRASGTYRVTRAGGRAIEGRIVLGVLRDRGRPRIGLIAVTPRG